MTSAKDNIIGWADTYTNDLFIYTLSRIGHVCGPDCPAMKGKI
jgi:hypothetical protein